MLRKKQKIRKINCDVFSKKRRKDDYATHGEGVLRLHKVEDHNTKESKKNIILGFKNDVQ